MLELKNGFFANCESMSEEFLLEIVRESAYALKHVFEHVKNKNICLVAVMQVGQVLQFVPERLKTEKVCLAAVHRNKRALFFVPIKMKYANLSFYALSKGGLVPEKHLRMVEFLRAGFGFLEKKRISNEQVWVFCAKFIPEHSFINKALKLYHRSYMSLLVFYSERHDVVLQNWCDQVRSLLAGSFTQNYRKSFISDILMPYVLPGEIQKVVAPCFQASLAADEKESKCVQYNSR